MKILLDTHVYIWFAEGDRRLGKTLETELESPENQLFLSIVSIWEMAIKIQLNKLNLAKDLKQIINDSITGGIEILPLLPSHVFKVSELEMHHRDPFDRIIIAQSLVEEMHIATEDEMFSSYSIKKV